METKIYVMTHKEIEGFSDPMYQVLHVKTEEGENIADKNCYYSELTGMYWIWKNVSNVDVVGTCHYRRFLINDKEFVLTESEIRKILDAEGYDIITTKLLQLNYSYFEGFSHNHKQYYLEETAKVIKELYPEYYPLYEKLVHEKHTYFGNILITRKELYDQYMEWLFSIFFTMEKRITIEEEDSYHRRIFGFISEFLQYVWITYHGLKVKECMVGMLGEKAEITAIKQEIARYFQNKDFEGAKEYFLECRRKRPDIMMEASDVTGELHLCMQVIAICGLEQQAYGNHLLNYIQEFRELMHFCNTLNHYVIEEIQTGKMTEEGINWMKENNVTEVAKKVSYQMFSSVKNPYQYIPKS